MARQWKGQDEMNYWIAWISPNSLNLGVVGGWNWNWCHLRLKSQVWWWWLWTLDFNLNLVLIIIYQWWDIQGSRLMWIAWIRTSSLNLEVDSGGGPTWLFSTYSWLKNRFLSNHFIDHAPISTWSNHSLFLSWDIGKGQADVNCLNQSNLFNLGAKSDVEI